MRPKRAVACKTVLIEPLAAVATMPNGAIASRKPGAGLNAAGKPRRRTIKGAMRMPAAATSSASARRIQKKAIPRCFPRALARRQTGAISLTAAPLRPKSATAPAMPTAAPRMVYRPKSPGPKARAMRMLTPKPRSIRFHGLILTLNLSWLWLRPGRGATPIVAHYHGGFPTSNPFLRRLQSFSLQRLSRALFTTREHAQPFIEAGLLNEVQVEEVMEVSTAFRMRPRAEARSLTGMRGDPVFLWAGRLHSVKDPLMALRGFAHIQASWPRAQLYCHYLSDELLPEVQAFLASRPHLGDHVHLHGPVPHDQMEASFNSADFLLQASRREYSGYVALEAMACGAIPVVTDIPSFRRMIDGGRYGILFSRGDAAGMARRVLAIDRATIPQCAATVRRHFEQTFSFEAMARRLEAVYRQVLSEEEIGDRRG
jgi:glycosyltransferase involved in cell wall biosynthesis